VAKKLLEYYTDSNASQKAETDDKGNIKLQFDEVPIQGRESKTTLYVKNSHSFPMQLRPVTSDLELAIVDFPSSLNPKQIAPVTFVFRPGPDRITPLHASWDFEKTIYEE
jgi:hypothetical protein